MNKRGIEEVLEVRVSSGLELGAYRWVSVDLVCDELEFNDVIYRTMSSDAEEDDGNGPTRILDIEADAAVRQVTVTWSDGRTALLVVTKDGRVEKAICRTRGGGRDGVLGTKAVGPLSGLLRRLLS